MKSVACLLSVFVLFFIAGCNSEHSDSSTKNKSDIKIISNSYKITEIGKFEDIFSISDNIDKSSLTMQSKSDECQPLTITENRVLSYSGSSSICEYVLEYKRGISGNGLRSYQDNILVVATKNNNYDSIVKFLGLNEEIEINIGDELNFSPNDYNLTIVKSLSDGFIEYDKLSTTFSFTSKTEGIKRVFYTIENQSGEAKTGVVDIYVVDKNKTLEINNETIAITRSQVTDSYEIDLSTIYLVNDIGEYQLVEVKEIHDNVNIEPSDREKLNNKRFTLLAQSTGTYYVVIVLVNERGDIGNSVLKIDVS